MESYGILVESYRERLYCAALRLVRNHDDARDLSQEAFVRFFQKISRFDPNRPFYPWLYRILHNLCVDHLRRHGTQRQVSLETMLEERHVQFEEGTSMPGDEPGDARDTIHAGEMAGHLRSAIEELKPEFREIVMMYHMEELSYKDIAEALDIPIGTVMSRLFHARKALAKLMEPHRG